MAMNQRIRERIEALREKMRERGVDYYMVPTADFHNSEYVSDYFKVREFLSGFTGSNGTLLVGTAEAGLWTDGRYFIQAQKELEGTGIILYRMGEEGVPTLLEYLKQKLQEGDTLGVDGRVISAALGTHLEQIAGKRKAELSYDEDLADCLWQHRPALPDGEIRLLEESLTGKRTEQKIAEVTKRIEEAGADCLLLSKLDDLMWLFNIRGRDIACNPVALSYGVIEAGKATIFLRPAARSAQVIKSFEQSGVRVLDYADIIPFLSNMKEGRTMQLDPYHCNYAMYKMVQARCEILEKDNPTQLLKAVKNETELTHLRSTYIKDSVAVTRFIYWLKQSVGREHITEYSAAKYLDRLRSELDGYLEPSFPTISAFQENAAMMHYEADQDNCRSIVPEGMLLVDSGGQYLGGTTDVTRTIVLGKITDEMKQHFTAVALGMLHLSNAVFLHGCTGRNLDILAREPLWKLNMDYKCGTGHGVGYILNVHEGPQSIRWQYSEGAREAVLEAGMLLTNEPGVYLEGQYGIRTENVMVVQNGAKNGDGQFQHFETLTYVPIDREALDPAAMDEESIAQLNLYHKKVYDKLAPFLNEEEAAWLKNVTAPIG